MPRYIDADVLLQTDLTHTWNDITDQPIFEHIIEQAPTADVVEVVRCRDCKFLETIECPITGVELLVCRHGLLNRVVEKEHFCSYGERREQG